MHLFNIVMSKSGRNVWCFQHFDLTACFAPQRRALFRHLNFEKCSGAGAFCTFWLPNVLRATTAWHQLLKVLRSCGALYMCFAPFRPAEPLIIGKTQFLATSLPFAHLPLFLSNFLWVFLHWPYFSSVLFCDFLFWLSSPTLSISAFHLSILSEVWLLNFLRTLVYWWVSSCSSTRHEQ